MYKIVTFLLIIKVAFARIIPTFNIIQEEFVMEKNELTDWMKVESSLTEAGTLDAKLSIFVDILEEMPSNFRMKLQLERQTNNDDFATGGLNIDQNYCDFIRHDKILMPLISKFGNFMTECPIKAGKYYLKDITMRDYQLPLALPMGTYRARFRYYINDLETVFIWKGKFAKA